MAGTAEDSLMALLEAMLTLAASEARRPKPPPVKPGGYPEEHFLDLTEDEKDELSCSICYQVLKETMQCINNHKFCHSCLLVWSTTGQYSNRIRCPVCRTQGYYFRNSEIDDRIGAKKVKCLMDSCKWSGLMKYLCSHRHTTYSDSSTSEGEDTCNLDVMPRLIQVSPYVPPRNPFTGTGLTTQSPSLPSGPLGGAGRLQHVSNSPGARASQSSLSSTSHESITELPWRIGPTSSRFSGGRVPGPRASGNSRITFSHMHTSTDNNNNVEENPTAVRSSTSIVGDAPESNSATPGLTPRPPSTPRPTTNVVNTRRLPRIINPPPVRAYGQRHQPPESLSLNINSTTWPRRTENLGELQEHGHESRTRPDSFVASFSRAHEINRQMIEIQQERERRRQEQLEEVRQLGQRLGQVASDLRRLLEQRRHNHNFSDDDDDYD